MTMITEADLASRVEVILGESDAEIRKTTGSAPQHGQRSAKICATAYTRPQYRQSSMWQIRWSMTVLLFALFCVFNVQAQTNPFAVGGAQGNGATGGNNAGNANGNGGTGNANANGNGNAGNAVNAGASNGSSASTGVAGPTPSAIPSSAAAGGITITQPQQTAAQSYYKIAQGISVTFAWNFTSVLRYPSSLVVQAYCSENRNTYTLASSLAGTATSFVWAPYQYDQSAAQVGQPQLIQATYRLQIMDERGLTVGAQAGLFQPNTKVEFALYQPKPYTPISEGWSCTGCNAAVGLRREVLSWPLIVLISVLTTASTFGVYDWQ